MENKKLIKVLLTILTVIVIVVLPIWIGPSKIDNKAIPLILEWALGSGLTVTAALGMAIVGYIGYIIYDFWSEIIN
jgi:hypothetical protein